jgi:8-oxo-dGTP pyrophosphatase MutT (NUDIX family)
MQSIVAVKGIIENNGNYLLAQHNNKLPANIGKWTFLGGWVEPIDDSFEATLKRELQEELGLAIEIHKNTGVFEYKMRSYLVLAAKPLGNPKGLSDEILNIEWLSYEAIQELEQKKLLHTGFEIPALNAYLNYANARD